MVDPRIEKLAKLCVFYSVDLKQKEKVLIHGSKLAFPLMHEIYKECLLTNAYHYTKSRVQSKILPQAAKTKITDETYIIN